MPLITRTLATITGLSTEGSIIDPAATPPNSLYNCSNVVFTRAGQVTARKGQIYYVDFSSITNAANRPIVGSYAADITEASMVWAYQKSSGGGQIVWKSTGALADECVVAYTADGPIRATSTAAAYDVAEFATYTPRFFADRSFLYVSSDNGLFRGEVDGSGNVNRYFKHVMPPAIKVFTPTLATGTLDQNWFMPGYAVSLAAVVVEYLEDGTPVEGPVSTVEVVENATYPGYISLDISALTRNIRDLSRTYIEIYRTLQYKFGEDAPTSFHQCEALSLMDARRSGAPTGDIVGFTALKLTANDLLVRGQVEIYVSPNAQGGRYFMNTTIPAANDVIQWKSYTVMAGIRTPAYTEIQMTGLPKDDGSETFKIRPYSGGSDVTASLDSFVNSAVIPASTGKMTTTEMTFKGSATSTYNLSIRPCDPKATSVTEKCTVPWVASITGTLSRAPLIKAAGANTTATVRAYADIQTFDINTFQSPKGAFAVVRASTGAVYDVICYDDYETISTSNTIEFYGCQSKANFTGAPWQTGTVTFYLYPLQSQSTDNLPIYPISSDSDALYLESSFSLYPTYYTYPTQKYVDYPVGVTGGLAFSGGRIVCTPKFFGVLWRSSPERLDRCVKKLVNTFNGQRAATSPYLIYPGDPYKMLAIGALAGASTTDAAFTNSGKYDGLFISKGGTSPTATYDLPVTATPTNFAESVYIQNGIAFSKNGQPECVALSQILAPTKVGSPAYPILRVAVNQDQLYVFKDQEGIFRVQLIEGGILPEVASVAVLDNTVFLLGKNSLQEINESIFFLSNKGVVQLSNGQLTNISRAIESEIKDAIAKQGTSINNIVSFKNEFRRQYGLRFPGANVTLVYDAYLGLWSKWDSDFTSSYASKSGALTLTRNLTHSAGTTRAYVFRERNTSGWSDASDQYDYMETVVAGISGGAYTFAYGTGGDPGIFSSLYFLGDWVGVTSGATKVYYREEANGALYPLTYVSRSFSSGNITFTFDNGASLPAGNGALVIGVNADVTLNRLWAYSGAGQAFDGRPVPSSPQGAATLSQFTECMLQVVGTHTNVDVRFEADNYTPTFASTYAMVLPAFTEIIRVGVPRSAARGRWAMVKIAHNYPFQKFTLAGVSWVFKDTDSHTVKVRST